MAKSETVWGGEFHYWRTPPDAWTEVFSSLKKLGFTTVATYVPWDFHEVAPRRYDFTGRGSPAKNLVGWLRLAQKNGLRVILRPGPYIYAEWNALGPPARIAKLPRLSEPFLREAAIWIRAVARMAKPFLSSRGGPIAMVQVCNEVTGIFEHTEYGDPKYRGIEKIYSAWARKAGAPSRMPRVQAHWGGSHLDIPKSQRGSDGIAAYMQFNEWYTAEYLRRMAAIFRAAGFDVPLFANLVSWFWPQNWPALQESLDFIAMDTYYPHLLPGNLPAAFAKLYRQFSAASKNPVAVEFGCGSWEGMHEKLGFVDERHLELTTLMALSQGVSGISYYMLVNRDNWYLSPVNEWGKIRERFVPAIQRLGKILKDAPPGQFKPLSPVGLVWRKRDHLDFVLSGGKFDHNYFGREWFEKNRYQEDYKEFWDLYEALLAAGYDVQVLDADLVGPSWPRATIFPVTSRWDGFCEDLARLHLKRGGCLVLAGDGADQIALKMPPSIGTPVQKWVRDLPSRDFARISEVLEGLGEKPIRMAQGKDLLQFVRVGPRGEKILYLFSFVEEVQQATVADASLKEIASGLRICPGGKIPLEPRSGRVFRVQ